MLQFIAILGISTFLSVVAYKIQHEEIQEKQSLLFSSEPAPAQITPISLQIN